MSTITSLQNSRVKAAIKLRDRGGREVQRRIVIDGVREIGHALSAGVDFLEIFSCQEHVQSPAANRLLREVAQTSAERIEVSTQVWDKLTFGHRKDGILVVAKPPTRRLDELLVSSNPLIVILDGIEKPGNVGAVVRSADGAGADAVIVTNAGTDLFNPNAIRASIGTIFRVPVVGATFSAATEWLSKKGIQTFLTIVDGSSKVYTEMNFDSPIAIVLGSEAHGVSEQWRDAKDAVHMHLPMLGAADSLNVSATATAVLYEVVRQRGL